MPPFNGFGLDELIFIDASVFLFHAFDDPDYEDATTEGCPRSLRLACI